MAEIAKAEKNWKLVGLIFIGLLGFIALNTYGAVKGIQWVSILPFALALIGFALLRPLPFWFLLTFATPLSIEMEIPGLDSALNMPTEPLIAFFLVLLVMRFLLAGDIKQNILTHPITIIILLQLTWMLVSSSFSSMPLVSFKYFFARIWYVVVFFFFGILLFKKVNRIHSFIWYFSLALAGVIAYTLFRHSQHHFSHEFSYEAALPFFKDHNIYAVVVAFFIPPIVVSVAKRKKLGISNVRNLGYLIILPILIFGVIASYTRAAWISLGAAMALYFIFLLRIKLRWLFGFMGLLLFLVWSFQTEINVYLSKNKATSDSDLDAHVQSIYNVTTDDSNTERLNRWSAAWRMFTERPIVGWGPNTYQFKYAPFQLSSQKTKISTNWGNLGNAHSEYIGPLAEMGLLGALLVLALILTTLHRVMRLFYYGKNERVRYLALAAGLALATYYVHGFLNNYLDTDKANVMVWAFFGIIVALDVYHNKEAVSNSSQDEEDSLK